MKYIWHISLNKNILRNIPNYCIWHCVKSISLIKWIKALAFTLFNSFVQSCWRRQELHITPCSWSVFKWITTTCMLGSSSVIYSMDLQVKFSFWRRVDVSLLCVFPARISQPGVAHRASLKKIVWRQFANFIWLFYFAEDLVLGISYMHVCAASVYYSM